ncbi:hypothetical protein ElyMa_006781200 [Elysia marginata]|uniref:Uncharacterized protein n=1 Tax=Elysia marginata TaxID=1093978 RepID=A0AAV4IZB0_9GAST|nr:hypothetical protein ElyMa_006781200 [Elysia marginata]
MEKTEFPALIISSWSARSLWTPFSCVLIVMRTLFDIKAFENELQQFGLFLVWSHSNEIEAVGMNPSSLDWFLMWSHCNETEAVGMNPSSLDWFLMWSHSNEIEAVGMNFSSLDFSQVLS